MLANTLLSLLALLGIILIGGVVLVTALWLVLRSRRPDDQSVGPPRDDEAAGDDPPLDPWTEAGRRYGDDSS
jgi:hypothetical protein